ncbi:P-loop containing nucleoside triphosphate hydrolase protein, partial [Achaetomium macrosporum]
RAAGKGLIFLLHGSPGTGKTSTAEAVVKTFQKSLFQVSCGLWPSPICCRWQMLTAHPLGDLGTTVGDVEVALRSHFTLASRWRCILLLVDADILLARQSRGELVRNGVVSVIMRVLDSFDDILFLSTNRVAAFGEAFASRIHLSLYYPAFDIETATRVLELNLRMIQDRFRKEGRRIEIEADSIGALTRSYWTEHRDTKWNGRQIRNACQTALALAKFDAQGGSYNRMSDFRVPLTLNEQHFNVVFRAHSEFVNFLKSSYGPDESGIAVLNNDHRRRETLEACHEVNTELD